MTQTDTDASCQPAPATQLAPRPVDHTWPCNAEALLLLLLPLLHQPPAAPTLQSLLLPEGGQGGSQRHRRPAGSCRARTWLWPLTQVVTQLSSAQPSIPGSTTALRHLEASFFEKRFFFFFQMAPTPVGSHQNAGRSTL